MSQLKNAQNGMITKEMREAAQIEKVSPEYIRDGVAEGKIVIFHSSFHANSKPVALGEGLRTKVNANIGTSEQCSGISEELEKLKVSIKAGADAVMDLSTAGDLDKIRKQIIDASPIPVGTVPIYQAAIEAEIKYGSTDNMTEDEIFEVIEKHAQDGVDFVTVHCGINYETIGRLKKEPRIMDVVSRGGALLISWIIKNRRENPLYEDFDRLLEMAIKYDLVLSLGDGMRPGSIADATDSSQIQELVILGRLAERAKAAGVQVIIEGPGHVPLDEIEANIKLEKKLCHGAPFYVLGPLPTDVAPGYDHITSAIGGAIAGAAGADFLCYVTPSEHLGLPTSEDVKQGVIASRIAAHAADIVKKVPGAKDWDLQMSKARKAFDWERQIKLSIDPEHAQKLHDSRTKKGGDVCSMCGEYCSMKVMNRVMKEMKP